MNQLKLFSPAKLNLFFRVLSKRPDGFHDIASLFQAVTLGDTLVIDFADTDTLVCSDPSIPKDHSNLILKAAALFRQKTGCSSFFTFTLEKKIPIEAGLGGGSSNAAATLWGLNQLLNTQIPEATLAAWGASLGSDVPFFFSSGRAFCEGRGEKVQSLVPTPSPSLWLAKPKASLSTAAVYKACDYRWLENKCPHKALESFNTSKPDYFNDLEGAAFTLMPQLKKLKAQILDLGFESVHMTGSGTTFFCLGTPHHFNVAEVAFIPVRFLHRQPQRWYEFGPSVILKFDSALMR